MMRKNKQRIRNYFLFTGFLSSSVVIVLFFLAWKSGVNLETAIFLVAILLILIIPTSVLGYYKALRLSTKKENEDSSSQHERKQYAFWGLKSSLILLVISGFGFFILFVKKMVITGASIMVLSGILFLYLSNRRLKRRQK